jgi:SAM-dependent methyltransferase
MITPASIVFRARLFARQLFKSPNIVANAKEVVAGVSLIDSYIANGRIPWSPGYAKYKNVVMREALRDADTMARFAEGRPLPAGYGAHIDERIVECPWAIAKLGVGTTRVLDAGSVLNAPFLLEQPQLKNRPLVVYSLEMDHLQLDPNISYVHGDFREPILRDEIFDTIVCISTLEHVGMWWIPKPPFEENLAKPQVQKDLTAYRDALGVFRRLLKPGGRLLLTMPYGFGEDQDWLQIFDAAKVADVKTAFGGETVSETYYRHTPDGWNTANPEDCADLRYFNIVKTPQIAEDKVAAARAVVCLELKRPA